MFLELALHKKNSYFSGNGRAFSKRPEESTKYCVSIGYRYNTVYYSARWATPCDGEVECFDGRDEQGCESPVWLLPAVLLVAIFLLLCSQFCFFYKYIRKELTRNTNEKCQQPLKLISCKQQKHIYIAMLLDQQDQEGIESLLNKEIENHRNDGKALCCFKVEFASHS